MNLRKLVAPLLTIAFVLFIAWLLIYRIHFDWKMFGNQLRSASPGHIAAGVALIYLSFVIRSWRWAVFLRPGTKVGPLSLLGSQFVGFSAVAMFGRLADLSRPYLIAKRTQTTVPAQIAVYTVERMFDLGAAALIFSSAFAFAPKDMPHHEAFVQVGVFSLIGTVALALIALIVRVSGVAVAGFARGALSGLSEKFANSLSEKILHFRDGLSAISSMSEFVIAAIMSLAMWAMIALSYVQTCHAFVMEPTLANLTFSQAMLLMAASIGGSLLQLPVVGWFTQIAVTSTAMHASYGTPIETATGCGALLLLVTSLSIVPVGLIYARVESISMKELKETSAEPAAV